MNHLLLNSALQEYLNQNHFLEFLCRLFFNLFICFLVIRFLYYPKHKNKDFVFTFVLFNAVNFIICFLLSNSPIGTGFAFGLFAIFSILRYRTVVIPVKEMGYFFAAVALGLINSLAPISDVQNLSILLSANVLTLIFIYLIEKPMGLKHENAKILYWENVEIMHVEKRNELIQQIKDRTGLEVHRVEVLQLDYVKEIAKIVVYYYSFHNENSIYFTEHAD